MPPMSMNTDAGAPPCAADAEAQAQAECQAADDCKPRGEPATGLQWTCDSGHCMQQAAEPPKAAEPAAADQAADKPQQKGKKKGKKK